MDKFELNCNHSHTKAAYRWRADNWDVFNKIVNHAKVKFYQGVKELSIRDICAEVRWSTGVHISNNITPSLARIIEMEYPELHFKKKKSKCEKKRDELVVEENGQLRLAI